MMRGQRECDDSSDLVADLFERGYSRSPVLPGTSTDAENVDIVLGGHIGFFFSPRCPYTVLTAFVQGL